MKEIQLTTPSNFPNPATLTNPIFQPNKVLEQTFSPIPWKSYPERMAHRRNFPVTPLLTFQTQMKNNKKKRLKHNRELHGIFYTLDK